MRCNRLIVRMVGRAQEDHLHWPSSTSDVTEGLLLMPPRVRDCRTVHDHLPNGPTARQRDHVHPPSVRRHRAGASVRRAALTGHADASGAQPWAAICRYDSASVLDTQAPRHRDASDVPAKRHVFAPLTMGIEHSSECGQRPRRRAGARRPAAQRHHERSPVRRNRKPRR